MAIPATAEATEPHSSWLTGGVVEVDERLEMAAALGDETARHVVSSVPSLPDHQRSKLELALALLSRREAVSFALDCAQRALPVWEAVFPDDRRPASAVAAANLWMSDDCSANDLSIAAARAEAAGQEADDHQPVLVDSPRTLAIHASHAASHVALTAESAAGAGSNVAACAAWTATFARKVMGDPGAEEAWQVRQLVGYLLRRIRPPE